MFWKFDKIITVWRSPMTFLHHAIVYQCVLFAKTVALQEVCICICFGSASVTKLTGFTSKVFLTCMRWIPYVFKSYTPRTDTDVVPAYHHYFSVARIGRMCELPVSERCDLYWRSGSLQMWMCWWIYGDQLSNRYTCFQPEIYKHEI